MTDPQTSSVLFTSRLTEGSPHCIIYSEHLNPRLEYVCEFIFNLSLGFHFEITNELSYFEKSTKFKVNYSKQTLGNSFKIQPSSLLFEEKVHQKKPVAYFKNKRLYLFEADLEESNDVLHFDLLASVFYFISRYEEWQNFEADEHGRFTVKNSLLYQHQFHLQPLVDLWIKEFKEQWQTQNPSIIFPEFKARLISTIDVDNLYAFKGKGVARTIGSVFRDLLKFDLKNIKTRTQVLFSKQKDPFDIYEDLSVFCENNQIPLYYFFLYRTGTKYDRTVQPDSQAFLEVFEKLKKQKVNLGLHPSYNCIQDSKQLALEFKSLSDSLGNRIEFSRQHFLRYDIRSTPQQLMEQGVLADFSMGFANSPGFRAGTSLPFHYYNFEKEQAASLWLVPFCFMDGAYSIHNKISIEEALVNILKMAESIQHCGGFFISVFHERSFSDHLYPGFARLYNKMNLQVKQLFEK